MIQISFKRQSVCMGDDAGNGIYRIEMPDSAVLGDLMEVVLNGGNGNSWPIPYTGANSHWIIRSNIGNLANIYTDEKGDWHIRYLGFAREKPLTELGISSVFGDRPD